jgi:hypothetical protein
LCCEKKRTNVLDSTFLSIFTKNHFMVSPQKLNTFLIAKLPSAYLCGVRVIEISKLKCVVSVKHRWINQNPFRSMYFAVQAMAAELSTGALVMMGIKSANRPISMLVTQNKSIFVKKATGRIQFVCNQGAAIDAAIQKTIQTGEGQTLWLDAVGTNEKGEVVSEFSFEWSIKVK